MEMLEERPQFQVCHLLFALANWLVGDSRLVAYFIRVLWMPVARDKRTGSR